MDQEHTFTPYLHTGTRAHVLLHVLILLLCLQFPNTPDPYDKCIYIYLQKFATVLWFGRYFWIWLGDEHMYINADIICLYIGPSDITESVMNECGWGAWKCSSEPHSTCNTLRVTAA